MNYPTPIDDAAAFQTRFGVAPDSEIGFTVRCFLAGESVAAEPHFPVRGDGSAQDRFNQLVNRYAAIFQTPSAGFNQATIEEPALYEALCAEINGPRADTGGIWRPDEAS
jgi:hypothetical protein